MALSLRTLSLCALAGGLAACVSTQVTPVWESYLPSGTDNRFETPNVLLRDASGALISAGNSVPLEGARIDELYVVKQNADGSVRWKTRLDIANYDRPWDGVTDANGNIYIAGPNYIVKFDSNGFEAWRAILPEQSTDGAPMQLVRDIELANGQLYVAGQALYVLKLDGQLLNTIAQPQPIWDVTVHASGLYTAGNGIIRKYQADGTPLWQVTLPAAANATAELAIANDGSVYAATGNNQPQDSVYLTRISANGGLAWSKFFGDPDTNSYALPGFPKLRLMPNGNLLIGLSQDPTRVLSLVDAGSGNVLKSMSNRSGLIDDLEVDAKGNVYVMGGTAPQKFDVNLTLLAEGRVPSDAQPGTGSIEVTADSIYVNTGATKDGSMRFYSARYENK